MTTRINISEGIKKTSILEQQQKRKFKHINTSKYLTFAHIYNQDINFLIPFNKIKLLIPTPMEINTTSLKIIIESLPIEQAPLLCRILPRINIKINPYYSYILVIIYNNKYYAYLIENYKKSLILSKKLFYQNISFMTTVYNSYPYISFQGKHFYIISPEKSKSE